MAAHWPGPRQRSHGINNTENNRWQSVCGNRGQITTGACLKNQTIAESCTSSYE